MTKTKGPPEPAEAEAPRGPGRPPLEWPDPIPDTPENVLRAVLATPEKRRDEWEYMKRRQGRARRAASAKGEH